MSPEVVAATHLFYALRRRIHTDSERGMSTVEWVAITAIVTTIAVTVGAILLVKLRTKATDLDLTTP
jgi:hypothetical protein